MNLDMEGAGRLLPSALPQYELRPVGVAGLEVETSGSAGVGRGRRGGFVSFFLSTFPPCKIASFALEVLRCIKSSFFSRSKVLVSHLSVLLRHKCEELATQESYLQQYTL